MSLHFQREIQDLKKAVLLEGARVEEAIGNAITAVQQRDARLAQQVIDGDDEIDRMEVEIEEECLKILALYQPVAVDLRFVIAVLKMNNDLERMGDLAANIAKRALYLAGQERLPLQIDLMEMAKTARSMVRRSLDALVNGDAALARAVCEDDRGLDRMRSDVQERAREAIRRDPALTEAMSAISSIGRRLERLGDMATNIAEDVIYMVEGEIIRHGRRNPNAAQQQPDR